MHFQANWFTFVGLTGFTVVTAMQILTGIVSLITELRPDYFKSFDPKAFAERDPKLILFLHGIAKKKISTDEEAAKYLFGKKPDRQYKNLKTELREVLIQQLFQLDLRKRSTNLTNHVKYNTYRDFLAACILHLLGGGLPAHLLMKEAFEKSLKAEQYPVALLASSYLRDSFFMREGKNKVEQYSKISEEIILKLQAEQQAAKMQQEITFFLAQHENEGDKILEKAKNNLLLLEKIADQYKTPTVIHNLAKLYNRIFFLEKDQRAIIENADNFIEYLDKHPLYSTGATMAEFILYKLQSYVQLRDYKEGLKCVEQCYNYYRSGSANWLVFLEFYFELCMHTQNYAQALNIVYEVLNHPQYESFSPERKERFKIFEAYVNYILPNQFPKESFDLFKFTEETPTYSEDKSGNFLTVIIAQVILMVELNRYDKLKGKEELIQNYLTEYVNKKGSPRTWYFFNMLIEMIKHDFDPDKSEKAAQKWFDKIHPEKNPDLAHTESIEVMPYDILWPDLLKKLKRKTVS